MQTAATLVHRAYPPIRVIRLVADSHSPPHEAAPDGRH